MPDPAINVDFNADAARRRPAGEVQAARRPQRVRDLRRREGALSCHNLHTMGGVELA